MLLGNGTSRFVRCMVATNLPFGKKATSAKYNKTRPACTDVTGLVRAEPDDMHTALSTAPGTSRALNKWYLFLLLAELF